MLTTSKQMPPVFLTMLESLSGKTWHAGTQRRQQRNITSCWRFNERSLDHITSFNTCQCHNKKFYFKTLREEAQEHALIVRQSLAGGGSAGCREGTESLQNFGVCPDVSMGVCSYTRVCAHMYTCIYIILYMPLSNGRTGVHMHFSPQDRVSIFWHNLWKNFVTNKNTNLQF